MMKVVSVNEAKENFDALMEQVVAVADPIVITTEAGQQIIMMSLREYNAWQETIYLLSNPVNAAHLRASIAEAQVQISN